MTLANIGFMLLGALLLAGGVLVASLADRVRGLLARHAHQPAQSRRQPAVASVAAREIEIDPADTIFVPDEPAITRRSDRLPSKAKPATGNEGMETDVIAALVAAGYHKRVASSAVQACDASERRSLTDWTRAALRRSREAVAS